MHETRSLDFAPGKRAPTIANNCSGSSCTGSLLPSSCRCCQAADKFARYLITHISSQKHTLSSCLKRLLFRSCSRLVRLAQKKTLWDNWSRSNKKISVVPIKFHLSIFYSVYKSAQLLNNLQLHSFTAYYLYTKATKSSKQKRHEQ